VKSAGYPAEVSDLQCPATFVIVPAGAPGSDLDAGVRLAALFAGDGVRVRDTAARLAATQGLAVSELEPPATGGYRAILTDLADLYRGETVAVVLDPDDVAEIVAPGGRPADVFVISIDADGWVVAPRPRSGTGAS
jgi:hypothetical protein